MDRIISVSSLHNQRVRYVGIRDEAARLASVFSTSPMAEDFNEVVRCTDAAIAALDKAIKTASELAADQRS